jgi:dTDP-4-dehydrorhamnose reductase
MKVAIIGAGGYLGTFITTFLAQKGYEVIPITRQQLNLTNFEAVTNWLTMAKLDGVINCATASNISVENKSYNDVLNNLNIFQNFYDNSDLFDKFINIGSGAEFDRTKSIDNAVEEDVLTAQPQDSYGFSKNIISRLSRQHNKFYTLRLFGCFYSSEPDFRLFKKVIRDDNVKIVDRYFDYISGQDFCTVLDHYLNNSVEYNDINCVYQEKIKLSRTLSIIRPVDVIEESSLNYTGNGDKLAKLDLNLIGLVKSIENY